MIATQRNSHYVRGAETLFGVVDNQSLFSASDGKNACLRRVDDGSKIAHSKHAQIGDGEGTALGAIEMNG